MSYLMQKLEALKKEYKQRDYFNELPILDTDFASYVIITNTPFVEEVKREKFKFFLSKNFTAKFHDRI